MSGKNNIAHYFRLFIRILLGKEKDITTSGLNKAIFILAIPMVIEMCMESIFAVVDIYFVSKLSQDAVAAVGLTESIVTLLFAIGLGMSMSVLALVSRRVGEKKADATGVIVTQGTYLTLMVSAIFAIVGIGFSKELLEIMGAPSAVIDSGHGYTQIILGSNIVIMFLFLYNAVLRGAGDAHLAMTTLIISNGINIVLDPLLIFGIGPFPELGLEGAAIATTIGRGIGVAFQMIVLTKGFSTVLVKAKDFIYDAKIFKDIIRLSLGGVGQYMIGTLSWVVLIRISTEFGSAVIAGYTIAVRIIMFTILPSWGLAGASATLVGQNLGAGNPERAEKSVWLAARYCVLYLGAISILFFFYSEPLMRLFIQDAAVVKNGTLALQYIALGYVFFAYGMVISQAFNGAGDTKTPTIINFFCYWLLEIPLAYLLAIEFNVGPKGIFISIALSISILALVAVLLFKKGKWKTVKV